jgi:small subunit ribosomal protein S4
MGDPKKISNKFSGPSHPWNKARLEAEKPLMIKYGLTNKSELWKVTSKLKTYKQNGKRLVALKGAQAELERQQMFEKLKSFGLVESNSLDEILGMQSEQLLDRRLQTIVQKKGLARTAKQARQMITHRHITVNGRKVTAPGYLVRVGEEHTIEFYPGSKFSREDHPERPPRVEVPGRSETNVESKEEKPQERKAPERKDRKGPSGARNADRKSAAPRRRPEGKKE